MGLFDRILKRRPRGAGGGLFADVAEGGKEESVAPTKAAKPTAAKRVKASAAQAVPVELMVDGSGEILTAFGLRWKQLVKVGGREESQQMAYRAKATHYVLRTHLMGYGILPKDVELPIFPAALLAAKMAVGTAIFAVEIANGHYWIAVVRNNQPTEVDEVVRGLSEAEVMTKVRGLMDVYGGSSIAVFTGIQNTGLPGQRSFSMHEIFDVARSDQERLLKLPPKGGRIPKPILYATLFSFVVLGAQKGYSEYVAHQARLAKEASKAAEESPEVAWSQVVQRFTTTTPVPDPAVFVQVRKSFEDQPVLWFGWGLHTIKCQANPMANETRNWTCQSTYERTRVGETSEQMKERVKQRYPTAATAFPSISTMVMTRVVEQRAKSLLFKDMVDPDALDLPTLSKLQGFLPVLAGAPVFKVVPFELKAPLRKDGKPHPKPAYIPPLYVGNLVLKGPVRSVDTVAQKLPDMQWDTLNLTFAVRTDQSQKGVNTSAATAELIGKVYAAKKN